MRYLFAGHGSIPFGLRDTVKKRLDGSVALDTLSVGLSGDAYKAEFDAYCAGHAQEDFTVFSDILIGSVNQHIMYRMREWNFRLFTGVSAALALDVIKADQQGTCSGEEMVLQNRRRTCVEIE